MFLRNEREAMTLINLICMGLMALGSLVFVGEHRKGTFLVDNEKKLSDETVRKVNRDSNRLFGAKIVSLMIVLASVAVFFLTEELTDDYQTCNSWSLYHVILLFLFAGSVIFGLKELNKPQTKEKPPKTTGDEGRKDR